MEGGVIQSIARVIQLIRRKVQVKLQRLPVWKILAILLVVVILVVESFQTQAKLDLPDNNEFGKVKKPKAERKERPHIILIVADDLGYNDVGYHGSEIKTPNLDWLANSGVRLENYYVQPICTSTRSELLSGRYQIHTGLRDEIWPAQPIGLPLNSPTMADKLREAGYSTHMVGKWHLGFFKKEYMPTYRGFDTFFGYLNGNEDYFTHRTRFKQWSGYDLRENEKPADIKKYNGSYSTHLFTEKAIDILKTHEKSKPLFLYIPFQAPATPLQVPDRYIKPYEENVPSIKRRRYAGVVSCMDEAVGNITIALKQLGYWKNSLIIFTTDNGSNEKDGGSNTPLRGQKSQYWEGGVRAVGFIYSNWLQKTMGGTVSRELIHVTDWFPTLVNLAGGKTNGTKPLDGYDQWNTITRRTPNQRTEILINIDPTTVNKGKPLFENTFDTRIKAAIRMDDWKLMTGYPVKGPRSKEWFRSGRNGSEHVWLFNIRNDPNELTDVSEKHQDLVQVMLGRLEHYQKTSVPVIRRGIDPRSDPAMHDGFWGPWL